MGSREANWITRTTMATTNQQQMHALIRWFSSWDEFDQVRFIDFLLGQCGASLIHYVKYEATKRLKRMGGISDVSGDFTRILPRSISLRIFSHLDVRSLGRCAEVCGYWKYLSESNETWKKKCRHDRIPVHISQSGGIEITGLWKSHYRQHIIKRGRRRTSQSSTSSSRSMSAERKPMHQHRPTKIPIARLTEPPPLVVEGWRMHERPDRQHSQLNGLMAARIRPSMFPWTDYSAEEAGNGGNWHARRFTSTPPPRRPMPDRLIASATDNGIKKGRAPRPDVVPWRPNAMHPEDLHFDKFGKNTAGNRGRVSSGHKPLRPSLSMHHLPPYEHNQSKLEISSALAPVSRPIRNQRSTRHLVINVHDETGNGRSVIRKAHSNGNGVESEEVDIDQIEERELQWRFTKGGAAVNISCEYDEH